MRRKSRPENPGAIRGDHRGGARNPGSPMASDQDLENPLAYFVERPANAGDSSGAHVRELSFSDTTEGVSQGIGLGDGWQRCSVRRLGGPAAKGGEEIVAGL